MFFEKEKTPETCRVDQFLSRFDFFKNSAALSKQAIIMWHEREDAQVTCILWSFSGRMSCRKKCGHLQSSLATKQRRLFSNLFSFELFPCIVAIRKKIDRVGLVPYE